MSRLKAILYLWMFSIALGTTCALSTFVFVSTLVSQGDSQRIVSPFLFRTALGPQQVGGGTDGSCKMTDGSLTAAGE